MDRKKIAGIVIAGIMILSILGVVLDRNAPSSQAKQAPYGDYKFKPTQQGYTTKINGRDYIFFNFPGDIEYYLVSDEVTQLISAPVYTVTYDPNSNISQNLAEAQYYMELQLADVKSIDRALTNSTDTALPQKTCADATTAQPVILLQQGKESTITAKNSCIIVQAMDPYDLYRQTERIIYTALGVMK